MIRILLGLIFVATLAAALSTLAVAQIRRDPRDTDDLTPPRSTRLPPMGDPSREVIERAMIARSVAEHRENLRRAEENAQIGAELRARFASNRTFGREEMRRLERMESLSRRIRNAAGGSNATVSLEREPREIADALAQLAERAGQLNQTVERTPRRVISTTIIEQANEMLALIGRVRAFVRQ